MQEEAVLHVDLALLMVILVPAEAQERADSGLPVGRDEVGQMCERRTCPLAGRLTFGWSRVAEGISPIDRSRADTGRLATEPKRFSRRSSPPSAVRKADLPMLDEWAVCGLGVTFATDNDRALAVVVTASDGSFTRMTPRELKSCCIKSECCGSRVHISYILRGTSPCASPRNSNTLFSMKLRSIVSDCAVLEET
eukprot:scaffold102672_cov27-Tisochrysis_lutea.AAC.2